MEICDRPFRSHLFSLQCSQTIQFELFKMFLTAIMIIQIPAKNSGRRLEDQLGLAEVEMKISLPWWEILAISYMAHAETPMYSTIHSHTFWNLFPFFQPSLPRMIKVAIIGAGTYQSDWAPSQVLDAKKPVQSSNERTLNLVRRSFLPLLPSLYHPLSTHTHF